MKAVHAVVVLLMAFGLIAHAETNIRFAPDIEKSAGAEDLVALREGLEKTTVRPRLMAATSSSKSSGTTVTATGDLDYVRGRGSLYFYFDVPASLKSVTSARVSMNSYDVDCPSATEHDKVYFNGTYIGRLQGYNNGWEINTFAVPASSVKIGQSNTMRIDVDVGGEGWVTGSKEVVLYLNGEEGEIGLFATSGLKNRIDLSWTANFSGTTFNVYRGSTPESLAIYQEGLTETQYSDTSVALGETYYYQVMSRTGISSGIVEGRCQDGSITLLATTAYYHEIRLMWNPDNCEGPYTIYRGSRVDDLAPLAYDVNDMSYTDTKVTGGETYYYRVVAANGIVSDVVKGTSKRAEIKLDASDDLADYIKLTWSCPVKDLEYKIYKSTSREGPFRVMPEDYWWDREDYKDSSCEIGGRYYYYVKSSLGVDSDIKEGHRIRKYEEPEISSLEMNHTEWFKGQNNYVAGDEVLFTVGFNTKGQRAKLRRLHVYQEGYDRPAYRGCREITNVVCNAVEIFDGDTYTVRVKLPTGSGGHGMFYFSAAADMSVDGHSCSIKNKDKLDVKRPVYFNKDIGDNRVEANWFNYWKEDGACPRLRQSKPKVVFAGVYKDVVKGSMVDAGLRYPDIYSDLAGAYGAFSNGHEDEVFIRTCEHGWITKAETMIEPWDYARYVVLNGREYDMWSTKMCKIGVDIVQKIIAHETRHWRTWHDYITELERHYGRRVGDLTKDDVYAVDSDFYEIEDDKWMAVIEKLKKSGGLVSLSVLKRVAPMVECGDRLTDNAEKRLNEELGIASQTKRFYETKADSFNLASMLGGSYRTYGDNEFLSRVAEIGVVGENANDWSSDGWLHDHFEELESRRKLMSMGARLSSANDNEETEATNSYGYVSCECASLTCVRNENDDVSGVVADIRFEFTGRGPCCVLGYLTDSNTNEYVVASCTTEFSDTNKNVRLNFEGTEISRARLKGPLRLGAVLVSKINPYARDSELVGVDVDFPNAVLNVDYIDCERLPGYIVAGSAVDISAANEIAFTYNVEANIATDFVSIAMLHATNGTFVSQASVTNSLSVGTNTICVAFDAGALYRAGVDGPYEVKTLQLWQGGELVDAMADVLPIANAYDYHSFEPSGTCVFLDESSIALEKVESGALLISFDVSNAAEETLDYEFSYAILGENDERVAVVAARHLYLEKGINHISEKIASSVIAESGVDGPYRIASILLKPAVGEGGNEVVSRPVNQSPAYKASDFAAASVAFSGETARVERADDSLVVAFDYETTRECTVVAAATLVDTNGNFVARAYSTNTVRRAGNWTAQLEFSWRDLAKENVGGPYRVAYFSLTPQGTGEESVVSDSLEIRDVNWLTPVAQQPIEVPEGVDWDSLFSWYVADGKVVAGRYLGTNAHEVVVVPSEHNGQPVARVGNNCFKSNMTVKAVVVSDGIVDIGVSAFGRCESLKTVSLPESLERIEGWAFSSCFALEQIHLPDSLQEIGIGAFWNDTSLEALWIPPSVLNIPDRICYQCSNLVMVAFPPVATNMGVVAFLSCPKLRSAQLPEGIKVLPNGAFYRDSQLRELKLPETLEVIDSNVVLDNDALTDLVFPSGVTNIGDWAFASCKALTNVVFRGAPPLVGKQPFPNGVQACYSLDYREEWEAEIVDGRWNGLWMRPETLPKRRIDTDVIADEAVFEGEVWSFDWDGTRAIQSLRNAPIGDGQHAGMTATLKGAGVITFDWRTSCEGMAGDGSWRDHAEFLVDGEVVSMRADESLWSRYSFELTGDGDHTVTWRYVKDDGGSAGEDCVWVSDIQFAAIADEETSDELLDESEYNWFYENTLVRTAPENPFEYNPSMTPEEATCQVDIQSNIGTLPRSALQDAIPEDVQAGICRVAETVGLEYAVVTSDGWEMVGNASLTVDEEETVKASFVVDYSTSPATIKYMISGHTLTNAGGASTFVCAAQKSHVESLLAKSEGSCEIHSWAGKYDVVNADVQQVAPGTETELAAGLDTFQNETFQVSGGGTLVIPSDKIPAGGVNRRLHVDGNSAVKFDLSGLATIPSVLKLFNGVGRSFTVGSNMELVVPGEGVDRVSKLFVKNGDLEARVAERPAIGDGGTQEDPFTVNVDDDSSTVSALVGNAVEGFWYGLLSADLLKGNFMLDPDSVKQCTGTGPLRLESSVNANGDSGFYRVSVSADKPQVQEK